MILVNLALALRRRQRTQYQLATGDVQYNRQLLFYSGQTVQSIVSQGWAGQRARYMNYAVCLATHTSPGSSIDTEAIKPNQNVTPIVKSLPKTMRYMVGADTFKYWALKQLDEEHVPILLLLCNK